MLIAGEVGHQLHLRFPLLSPRVGCLHSAHCCWEFMGEFTPERARYVIMVSGIAAADGNRYLSGLPRTQAALQETYHAVKSAETYTILERNAPPPGANCRRDAASRF